jgi:hypothetical protein
VCIVGEGGRKHGGAMLVLGLLDIGGGVVKADGLRAGGGGLFRGSEQGRAREDARGLLCPRTRRGARSGPSARSGQRRSSQTAVIRARFLCARLEGWIFGERRGHIPAMMCRANVQLATVAWLLDLVGPGGDGSGASWPIFFCHHPRLYTGISMTICVYIQVLRAS